MIAGLALLVAPASAGVTPQWEAPKVWLEDQPFVVKVEVRADASGDTLPVWMLQPAAFSVDGKPLSERGEAQMKLAGSQTVATEIDLGAALAKLAIKGSFELAYAGEKALPVQRYALAQKGVDYLKLEPAELARHLVRMETNRGTMLMEFWPDVAPEHVRNFLDLCASGFYEKTGFHRVIPGFMIQGGDPTGTGGGNGPRTIKHEFSDRKHVAGVLSTARQGGRTPDEDRKLWDTASCQFFVMHATYPSLDGKYSAFGKLVSGLDVVEKIVNTPRGPGDRPNEPQKIVKTTVYRMNDAK